MAHVSDGKRSRKVVVVNYVVVVVGFWICGGEKEEDGGEETEGQARNRCEVVSAAPQLYAKFFVDAAF